jgi:hypothetical protein
MAGSHQNQTHQTKGIKMKKGFIIFASLVLALSAAVMNAATEDITWISGYASDNTGQPLQGATATLCVAGTGRVYLTTTTNASGHYVLTVPYPNIPIVGNYYVRIFKPGNSGQNFGDWVGQSATFHFNGVDYTVVPNITCHQGPNRD